MPAKSSPARRILAIDIGATGLKAALVGPKGAFLTERVRIETPHPCPPALLVKSLVALVKPLGKFDHVAIGFPGFVKDGKVLTAPNLDTDLWAGYPLERVLAKKLGKPARLLNDADIQGLAAIKGRGLELVCTLGTGFGTAWFRNGELMPHMDLAHMSFHPHHDFDDYIGAVARDKLGTKQWNRRLAKLIPMLSRVFNYDHLYLGGGNSRKVKIALPINVTLVSNDAGMEGAAFAWNARSLRPAATRPRKAAASLRPRPARRKA